MTEISQYTPGTFCWTELATSDAAAAKTFYTGLFGWEVNDFPMGEGAVYSMLQIGGKDVAALYQMQKEQQDQGMPPNWLSYISVTSADQTVAKAKALGGKALTEAFDVFDFGRMAHLQDPQGAMFAVWQPKQHIGARLTNQPGTLAWNELATTNRQKAVEFYTGLFGWGAQDQQMPNMVYTIIMNGDAMNGGIMQLDPEWGDVPPYWTVYFAVADCDRSAEKARQLGGEIKMPPTDIPDTGRFAMLQDPQGASFAIIKLVAPS
jgi:hypothetical protein